MGASAYRIDLAIRDPRDRGRYLLGVECDGATYHGSRTARDRDLLRQEVLKDQGWRLYRVWSTEWFRDRDAAAAKLLRAIQQAHEAPVEDSMPAPAPPASAADEGAASAVAEGPRPSSAPPIERRFPPGERYRKHRETGRRDLLLESDRAGELINQIVRVVASEGPIHEEVLLERLKDLNGVDRAGVNVQRNVDRATTVAISRGRFERKDVGFLGLPGSQPRAFRVPGDDISRQLSQIALEEIALAVLHKVEDHFGYQREALPRAVAELLGFDRLPPGGTEIVGTVVDRLVERGRLAISGPYVYLV